VSFTQQKTNESEKVTETARELLDVAKTIGESTKAKTTPGTDSAEEISQKRS